MTKAELIQALDPYMDEAEIVVTNGVTRQPVIGHSYGTDENAYGIALLIVPPGPATSR